MKRVAIFFLFGALLLTQANGAGRSSRVGDTHSYYQLFGGKNQTLANTDLLGFGMRIAFPVSEDFLYFGLMFDGVAASNYSSALHVGLSMDIELSPSLYLIGNYGRGYLESNTSRAYGNFYDLGLQLQFSDYIGVDAKYRRSDYILGNGNPFQQDELLYTLNIAITHESAIFFRTLFDIFDNN